MSHTLYLAISTLLGGTDINKVKQGAGLGEANSKFLKVGLANGFADAGKVGKDLGNDLNIVGAVVVVEVYKLLRYGCPEGSGSLFAAFEALLDPLFLEL